MSQDIVADALNQIMNAKRSGKNSVKVNKYSKVLSAVLAIGKLKGYIKDFRIEGKQMLIEFELNKCLAVKPRFVVRKDEIDKYVRRYLPSKNMGVVIVSTSKGLMTHQTAVEKNLGGSIIAYFY